MATVINTPATRDTSDGAAAGWAVAVVVLIAALLVALFVWPGYIRPAATQSTVPGTNINVQLPSADTTGTGGNAGASGSTNTGGTGATQGTTQTAPTR